jgi:hypothetical protein
MRYIGAMRQVLWGNLPEQPKVAKRSNIELRRGTIGFRDHSNEYRVFDRQDDAESDRALARR